jgi:hypothetical protein
MICILLDEPEVVSRVRKFVMIRNLRIGENNSCPTGIFDGELGLSILACYTT